MSKIAVHLHLYYLEMWGDVKGYLTHLSGLDHDLYITMVSEEKGLIEDILAFNPRAKIIFVPNKGYDVAPFIRFLQEIRLEDYDYIIKVHTKNKYQGVNTLINRHYISREFWYKLLFNALLGSRKIIRSNLRAFEKDARLGMLGSKYLITSEYQSYRDMESQIRGEMARMGYPEISRINFVAGTMFMVRSALMKPVLSGDYITEEFEDTRTDVRDFTLAHVMERALGCLVEAQGYKLMGFGQDLNFRLNSCLMGLKRFCYQRKITRHNKLLIKTFKLPVYSRKLGSK